jgi:TonB family protein
MTAVTFLVSLIVKSTILLSAASLAAYLLRRRAAAVTHAVWMGAFLALAALPVLMLWMPALKAPAAFTFLAEGTVTAADPATAAPGGTQTLLWIWLVGVAIALARLTAGHARALLLASKSTEGVRRNGVRIRELDGACVPMTLGLFRPVVILPCAARSWPEALRDSVLGHEFAHIERRDTWWLLLSHLVCCFYWMQPLAWWAARRAAHDSERACDDMALENVSHAPDYAAHLVDLARSTVNAPWPVAAAVRPSSLELRVRAILDSRRDRRRAGRAVWPAALTAAFAVLLPLAALQAQDRIYSVKDEGVSAPRLLHKVEPMYTQQARDAKLEGRVILMVTITAKGNPSDVTVTQSLEPGLDANAVDAVRQWLFEPGKLKGKPVAVRATIEVNFRLL